jgi:hypothetical protein
MMWLPIAISAGQPSMRSAPPFQDVMTPSIVFDTIASSDDSTMAASNTRTCSSDTPNGGTARAPVIPDSVCWTPVSRRHKIAQASWNRRMRPSSKSSSCSMSALRIASSQPSQGRPLPKPAQVLTSLALGSRPRCSFSAIRSARPMLFITSRHYGIAFTRVGPRSERGGGLNVEGIQTAAWAPRWTMGWARV